MATSSQRVANHTVVVENGNGQDTSVKQKNASTDKSLESWIWDAACSIRGAKDAPKYNWKYKEFILPLIFAKHLWDVYDDDTPNDSGLGA